MIYVHNIFMANSYMLGRRIAYDNTIRKDTSEEFGIRKETEKVLNKIKKQVGSNAVITNQVVLTESRKWKSVVDKDSFFADVEFVKDIRVFISVLKDNNIISELDMKMFLMFLFKKSDPYVSYDINHEFDVVCRQYLKEWNKPFYDDEFLSGSKPIAYKTVEKISGVLFDKILSGTSGPERIKFMFEYVRKRTGNIIFL